MLAIVRNENVSRMGIGVEKTINEDLFQIRSEKLFGDRGTIHVDTRQRAQGRDFCAVYVFHGQDTIRGITFDGARHQHALESPKTLAEYAHVLSLLRIIQLAQETEPQFVDDLFDTVTA